MADARSQIDISLSLLGGDSSGVVSQLISRMSDLDNKLRTIAIDTPGQGDLAASYRQMSDRKVIQTGSMSLSDPMRDIWKRYGQYDLSSSHVSPMTVSQKDAKERLAAASELSDAQKRGQPEHAPVMSHRQRREAKKLSPSDYIEGPNAPKWMSSVSDLQNTFEEPIRMPRYGEYTVQDKLDFAARIAGQRALKKYHQQEDVARQAAEAAHRERLTSSQSDPLSAEQETQVAQAGQTAAEDVNFGRSASGSISGSFAKAAKGAAMTSVAAPFAIAGAHTLLGTTGLRDVTAFDPNLLDPLHYVRHPFQAPNAVQAMGMQSGYAGSNQNINMLGMRNIQNPLSVLTSAASREGYDMLINPALLHHQYSRVSVAQAAQLQADVVNEGFRGAQRKALTQAGSQIMQNTGIDPTIIAPMLSDSSRYGASSLKDMTTALNNIPAAAQRAGMSVNAYAEALHQFSQDAVANRGANPLGATTQAMGLTNGLGITLPDAQKLASSSGVQTFTMMNTGVLPGMQGNLPAAAIQQGSQQYLQMLKGAAGAFARPTHTDLGAYGSVTQSKSDSLYAAMSMETGGALSAAQIKAMLDPKAQHRTQAESAISVLQDPTTGVLAKGTTEQSVQDTAYRQGLLGTGKKGAFNENWLNHIKDPKERLRQLKGAINPGSPDNSGAGLPSASMTISLADDIKKFFNLSYDGKKGKSTKWEPFTGIARAGGASSAIAGIDPLTAKSIGNSWGR